MKLTNKGNQIQSLKYPCRLFQLWMYTWYKEIPFLQVNPVFEKKERGNRHYGCVIVDKLVDAKISIPQLQ